MEIVVWACHGEKFVYGVVEEEGGEEDELSSIELVVAEESVKEDDDEHEVVVAIVATVECFGPEGARHVFAELDGWLAAEDVPLDGCEDVVEVGQLAAEVIDFLIPEDESEHHDYIAEQSGSTTWEEVAKSVE